MKSMHNKTNFIIFALFFLIIGVIIGIIINKNTEKEAQITESIPIPSIESNYASEQGSEQGLELEQGLVLEQGLEQPESEPPLFFIALGDSIPAGYGVSLDERYPDLLFGYLYEDEIVNDYKNFSIVGFTTGMLLNQLGNLNINDLEAFINAQVISINIGGNNILAPLIDYLPDFQEITDMISSVGSLAGDAMEVAAELEGLNAELEGISNNFTFSDLLRVGEFFNRASSIFNDSVEMFGRMNELSENNPLQILSGPLPPELDEELKNGVTNFAREFGEIMAWFNMNAPNAVIIVNTLYNPIPEEILGLKLELSGQAEIYTQMINDIIKTQQNDYGYLIADIYNMFADKAELSKYMNYHLDLSKMNLNFDIIHPNDEGHRMIADLNYKMNSKD